ncbi:MAG: hypothetical protein JRD68_07605, partial [Deltaproteobacteria bacterium]|nr:hypothetical protein [Deltaproteobacteria bacterium]
KHFATGADPGPDWHSPGYDDAAWSPGGSTPFYLFRKGNSTGAYVQTTYFRKQIQIADASLFTALHVNVWRDDGAIVYLNGVEIFRSNMPVGSVAHDTPALYEILSQRLAGTSVEMGVLQTGENWLAVETHSSGNNDNELYFDLELVSAVEEILIPVNATGWKFTPTTSTPEPYQAPAPDYLDRTWTQAAYNDLSWGEGQGVIGFGNGGENTLIGYNTSAWPRTIYFRHLFNPETQGFDYLRLQLLRDDAAVVYLNGVEILNSNLPTGLIDYNSAPVSAIGPSGEGQYIVKEINLDLYEDLLIAGNNAVAVEIHQHSSETGGTQAPQTAVTPTPASFNLRLLLHNDGAGQARLLKEVYQMYRIEGNQAIPVLLSNDLRIPDFNGPGWRLSAIGMGFEGASGECGGALGPEGAVTCTATLPANHPSNPFLHTFHPDHDNWNARYDKHYPEDEGSPEESFAVERTITFTFETKYPPGCEGSACRQYPPPGWGATRIGGTYREVIKGLHKDDITVTGPFSLDRVSVIDQLQQ